jgi:hypothetical protein
MTIPYAALIGVALNASKGIGDRISRAYRGGNPERDRDNARINQQYLDAVARKYGYGVNYAGGMPGNEPEKPLLGSQPGLGPALQALMGGDDKAEPGAGPSLRLPADADIDKYSHLTEPTMSGTDPTSRFSLTGDYEARPYSLLGDDEKLEDPWRRL